MEPTATGMQHQLINQGKVQTVLNLAMFNLKPFMSVNSYSRTSLGSPVNRGAFMKDPQTRDTVKLGSDSENRGYFTGNFRKRYFYKPN